MPAPTPLQLLQPVLTLNPGTYCSTILATGSVTLNPGVYVFDGADLILPIAATLAGNGVTLVFTSSNGAYYGTLAALGVVSLNLSPMTTGPTAGIAIWLDLAGTRPLAFVTALSVLNVTGAIYAPASPVNIIGVSATPCAQIVAWQISILGATTLRHNCTGLGTADVIAYKLLE